MFEKFQIELRRRLIFFAHNTPESNYVRTLRREYFTCFFFVLQKEFFLERGRISFLEGKHIFLKGI